MLNNILCILVVLLDVAIVAWGIYDHFEAPKRLQAEIDWHRRMLDNSHDETDE